ncbi:MAG TPA: hypothetical protein VFW76_08160 [Ktedonobacterales bacterium]|nr:hypothetical protein [Ktedonobacterales bacterium]
MNRYFQEKWPWIEGTHGMRLQLLDALSDERLSFNPGGENVMLGALCRESGDVEYSYIQSLKTFKQDWSYHNEAPGIETSVERLRAWSLKMDEEMKAIVEGFSDDDLTKTIDRGTGFSMPVDMQLDVYLQALLIFFGKASIYCKALGIAMTPTFKEYIG